MVPHFVRAIPIIAGAFAVTACGIFTGPGMCTDEARPGIRVNVLDSLTNTPITEGVRVIARSGTFADTSDPGFHAVAFEQAGMFDVTVEKDGYRLWSRDDVRVQRDECHVRTVDLTARLQR